MWAELEGLGEFIFCEEQSTAQSLNFEFNPTYSPVLVQVDSQIREGLLYGSLGWVCVGYSFYLYSK